MTVGGGDLHWRMSQAAGLGGAVTGLSVPSSLFPIVNGAQAATGVIDYRCVYFRNESDDAVGLMDPKVFVAAQPPSGTEIAIGLDPAGRGGTAAEVVDGHTPPAGVVFSAPSSMLDALSLPGGNYHEGDYVAVWIRRTVAPGAASTPFDPTTIKVRGDTV